jgi:hypothetical protein
MVQARWILYKDKQVGHPCHDRCDKGSKSTMGERGIKKASLGISFIRKSTALMPGSEIYKHCYTILLSTQAYAFGRLSAAGLLLE